MRSFAGRVHAAQPASSQLDLRQSKNSDEWVTPVLGPGVAPLPLMAEKTLGELIRSVVAGLTCDQKYPQIDGVGAQEFVRDFLIDLGEEHLSVEVRSENSDAAEGSPAVAPPWLTELAYVAAVYRRILVDSQTTRDSAPRKRPGDGAVKLAPQGLAACRYLLDHAVTPARDAVNRLSIPECLNELLPPNSWPNFSNSWPNFLSRIGEDLSANKELSWARARALSAVLWICMMLECAGELGYPGWTDVRVLLGLAADTEGDELRERIGDRSTVVEIIRNLFDWPQANFGKTQAKVAEVLRKQDEIRREYRGEVLYPDPGIQEESSGGQTSQWVAGEPPPPVAFVTSFDLGLEAALKEKRIPFSLALPVDVHVDGRRYGLWILGDVSNNDNSTETDKLQTKLVERWRVLRSDEYKFDLPVVVRLAGCPSITLPDLPDLPSAWNDEFESQCKTNFRLELWSALRVAITVDNPEAKTFDTANSLLASMTLEHAPLIGEHEAIWRNGLDGSPDYGYGLPRVLCEGFGKYRRTWRLVGTQLDDDAVRHRLLSFVAPEPEQTNATAFNRDLGLRATPVLGWTGIEHVKVSIG